MVEDKKDKEVVEVEVKPPINHTPPAPPEKTVQAYYG